MKLSISKVAEHLVFTQNLRIKDINFNKNSFDIILNTKFKLTVDMNKYPKLKEANIMQLINYRLISGGIGIYWVDLDEHLSLKEFLVDFINKII